MKHALTDLAVAVPMLVVGNPASVSADTPGRVTRSEFRALRVA